MHLKRQVVSKMWAIPRKGTKYLVVPSHSKNNGIPLLVALRDTLKVVSKRKELEKILHEKKIEVNGKVIKDDNRILEIFDRVHIKPTSKFYRVNFSDTGKLILEEIPQKDGEKKISKIINKVILKGKKIQLNLMDGRNIISSERVNVGDSVVLNFKTGKIESILPVKEKAKVLMIKGSHKGIYGEIDKIELNKVIIKTKDKKFETKKQDLMVVD